MTAQLMLSTPYARVGQPQANGGWRSYFLQPWRGYMDTWPASRLLNSFGINFNPSANYMPVVAKILAQSGCSTFRFEVGFGAMQYGNPSLMLATTINNITPTINLCLQYGIRPLVTLNSNSSVPCPFNNIVTQASAGNIGDPSITITGSMTGIRAGYTGLTGQGFYQTACPLITSIAGNVCTLSQPLAKAFSAGNITLVDLLYHPFSAEAYSGVSNPFADETINGWMSYIGGVASYMASQVGPAGFDVEIWNELSFGSHYLNESNYYNPARTPTTPVTYTNATYGITWGSSGVQQYDITYILVARTVDFFHTNYPGVKTINGFGNTVSSYNPTSQFWPYLTGFSRHGYTGSQFQLVPYNAQQGSCAPGSGNAAPDQPTVGPWKYDVNGYEGTVVSGNVVASGSFFVPVFQLASPEAPCLGVNPQPILIDFQAAPNPQGRYRGVTSPAPANNTAEWWETEYNCDTGGIRSWLTGLGHSASDPRFIYLNQWFQAKFLLRAWIFHVHKGLNKMVVYAVTNGDPLTFQMFPAAFFSAMDKSGDALTPDVQSQLGPQMTTFQNTWQFFNGYSNPNSFTVSPVSVNYLVEYQPRLVVMGDGTSSNPTLTHADEYGIFPWQFDVDRYCIGHYVVTRNAVHRYNQGTDDLDPVAYTMPDQYFEIGLSFAANPNFRVDQARYVGSYDPMTNQWAEEQIISRDSQNIAVKVKSTDYPRFLYIGATVPPFSSKIFSGKSGRHGHKS